MTKIDPRIQFPDDAQSGQIRGTSKGASSRPASSSSGVSSASGEEKTSDDPRPRKPVPKPLPPATASDLPAIDDEADEPSRHKLDERA